MTRYKTVPVGEHSVFYREAGQLGKPAILLLHGFPTSSFMFRDLIPLLAADFHVFAPDLPGFGLTQSPPRGEFTYDFAGLTDTIEGFVNAIGLTRFAIYVFDYGAPVGFRLALRMPDRIAGIVTQNGNAYEEGLSSGWAPIRNYWAENDDKSRETIRGFYGLEGIRFQYLHGVPDPASVSPDGYHFDTLMLAREGNHDIQLDLIYDYRSNVALYPDFQNYLREYQPPLLAAWGNNDPFFLPVGAEAFKRDIQEANVHFFETGHFALETHVAEIATLIINFLRPT